MVEEKEIAQQTESKRQHKSDEQENGAGPFSIQKSMWETQGVIGRWDCFVNAIALTLMIVLGAIPFLVGLSTKSGPATVICGLISLGAILPLAYYGWMNLFKRLRDIRGTLKDETLYRSLLFGSSMIPYVGFVPQLVLLFIEGKITSGKGERMADHQGKTEQVGSSVTKLFQPKENKTEQISNLEKLYKLKESGAISEEEFNECKKSALEKIAS